MCYHCCLKSKKWDVVRSKFYLMFPVKMKSSTGLLLYWGRAKYRGGFKGSGWEAGNKIKMMNEVGMLLSTKANWVL